MLYSQGATLLYSHLKVNVSPGQKAQDPGQAVAAPQLQDFLALELPTAMTRTQCLGIYFEHLA